jgi:hypothetical protein
MLEKSPATDKLLLLDIVHDGTGTDLVRQPSLPEMLAKLTVKPATTRIIGAAGPGQRGLDWPDRKQGVFGYFLAQAFRGAADADKNLKLTAEELASYLDLQMKSVSLPGGSTQSPYLLPQ